MGYLCSVNECVNMNINLENKEWKNKILKLGICEEDIEKVINFNQQIQINMRGKIVEQELE